MRPTTNAELIHLFAQRTESAARYGNLFFDNNGKNLYSYGHHYLLAQFIENKDLQTAVIINDSGYSNSTAKHIGIAGAALSHYKQFRTTQTDGKAVFLELENLLRKLAKAKKPELYLNSAESLYNNYNAFRTWKGIKPGKGSDAAEFDKKIHAIYKYFAEYNSGGLDPAAYEKKKAAAKKAAENKAKKAAIKKHAEDLQKFFDFEINYIYKNSDIINEDFVRINPEGHYIETSQGVKINPVSAALLYKMIKAGKDIKGHKIDHYTVINLNGVLTIGCHKINRVNMEQTGEALIKLGY